MDILFYKKGKSYRIFLSIDIFFYFPLLSSSISLAFIFYILNFQLILGALIHVSFFLWRIIGC